MDLSFLNVLLPMLFQGLKVTIYIAVVGILLGFLLGAVTGFVLQTNCRVLKAIAGIYIWVIRATPLIAQTMVHIIIPPAFRSMLPALFNQFIISVKDTALLSVIVVNEITKQIQNYAAISFRTIEAYTAGAVFYLVLISILIILQKLVEHRIRG